VAACGRSRPATGTEKPSCVDGGVVSPVYAHLLLPAEDFVSDDDEGHHLHREREGRRSGDVSDRKHQQGSLVGEVYVLSEFRAPVAVRDLRFLCAVSGVYHVGFLPRTPARCVPEGEHRLGTQVSTGWVLSYVCVSRPIGCLFRLQGDPSAAMTT